MFNLIPIPIFKDTIKIIELVFTIRLESLIVREAVAWVALEPSHLKITILRWDLILLTSNLNYNYVAYKYHSTFTG